MLNEGHMMRIKDCNISKKAEEKFPIILDSPKENEKLSFSENSIVPDFGSIQNVYCCKAMETFIIMSTTQYLN